MPEEDILDMPKETEKPQRKGLFSRQPASPAEDTLSFTNELADLGRRTRVIEERLMNFRTKMQVTDQNLLNDRKKVFDEVKALNTDIIEIKKAIDEIKTILTQTIEELKKCAKREEVKILQKYIDMWEPVNFVTHNEVEQIVNDIVKKLEKDKRNA